MGVGDRGFQFPGDLKNSKFRRKMKYTTYGKVVPVLN
jgi:hypothetical protein